MVIHGINITGATSYVDCWAQNIVRTLPSTAVNIGISSNDAKDTSAGVGARTVEIQYLDANYALQTENVILAGTTEVDTVGNALRIVSCKVLTAGSELDNAGIIYIYDASDTVTAGVPQTATKIFGRITPGDNVMKHGMFTVPAGERWRLLRLTVGGYDNTTTAKTLASQIQTRKYNGLWMNYELPGGTSGGASGQGFVYWEPMTGHPDLTVFEEKTDVRIQGKSSAAGLWMCIIELEPYR